MPPCTLHPVRPELSEHVSNDTGTVRLQSSINSNSKPYVRSTPQKTRKTAVVQENHNKHVHKIQADGPVPSNGRGAVAFGERDI